MSGTWLGIVLAGAVAHAAGPGGLDPAFSPELRAPAIPTWAAVGPDGRSWVAGGFDRADGASTGDLRVIGENGGISAEPAPGYLAPSDVWGGRTPFPLADGSFLLPAESSGWLRMNSDGTPAGPAFPGLAAGESVIPQFERDGKLWVIRVPVSGPRKLERRESADGTIDPGFSQGTDWPDDVLETVPHALGGAWVLTGDHSTSSGFPPFLGAEPGDQHVFLVHGSGAVAGEMRVLSGYRSASLAAAADGSGGVRVVLGADRSRWFYRPAPESLIHTIEWCSPEGVVLRSQNFSSPLYQAFVWAESADGSLVATGRGGDLIRFDAAGVEDESFQSPGKVQHVAALPDGKWLVDGVRRLNADGSPDTSWTVPDLDRPAKLKLLQELPDGRVLAAGDFDEVDGSPRQGLAVFETDGSLDPSFIADERIAPVISAAITADSIYLATSETVTVREDLRANLVKIRFDGSLDESFSPAWSVGTDVGVSGGVTSIDGALQLDALKNGDVMVTSYGGYEVRSSKVSRVTPEGSTRAGFAGDRTDSFPEEVVPVAKGGFARGGLFYKDDGSVSRDLQREGFKLDPLTEWQGGMLFLERPVNSPGSRLRLWKGKKWVASFISQKPDALPIVEAGEKKRLYIATSFSGADQSLRRLAPNGKLDPQFRSAIFGKRARREPGTWWTAGESAKIPFDPAANEEPAFVTALLWNSKGGRLWVAGDFNVVDGQARDGLAWIAGGKKLPPLRPRR
ncbi:delta-60 repeat domain-containing protein [Luteolibacter sp. Populi]|uniref:delta-60 repeat domain-containing protein n=1 Tax=Luteolibacter sp. Populi TaxID=3230487 RepID=UPI0034660C3B